jgi:predicted Zn-dependent protease
MLRIAPDEEGGNLQQHWPAGNQFSLFPLFPLSLSVIRNRGRFREVERSVSLHVFSLFLNHQTKEVFMLKPRAHSYGIGIVLLASTTLLWGGGAVSARSQEKPEKPAARDEKNKQKSAKGSEKNEKENQKKAAAEQPNTKQARKYLEIREFSYKLYDKDPSFREEVEAAYRSRLGQHNELAYFINTRDAADEQVTRTGDKLKIEDTLYDNPLVQDYVNRVGQSMVPAESKNRYAFKVLLKPIPEARSLSTGTIYISSGLISLVDNEAQLAYILAHEIAHVEKEHWRQDAIVGCGLQRHNQNQANKREMYQALFGVAAQLAAGSSNNPADAYQLSQFMQTTVPSLVKWFAPNAAFTWDKLQEDEADQLGLKFLLDRRYDPREAPKLFLALRQATINDPRCALGLNAQSGRVAENAQQVEQFITGNGPTPGQLYFGTVSFNSAWQQQPAPVAQPVAQENAGKSMNPLRDAAGRAAVTRRVVSGPLAAEIAERLKTGGLIGSSDEFEAVMAELKRDNGVQAYYYDMFQVALNNLEEALNIRSNDPYTHFYYGKVLKLTARTPAEKNRAISAFKKAIELDRRNVLAEPHLYYALAMVEEKNPAQMPEITRSLKRYVATYQKEHAGALPPNMDVIYAYLQEADDWEWAASPATNVSMRIPEQPANASANTPAPPSPVAPAVTTPLEASVATPTPVRKPKRGSPKP